MTHSCLPPITLDSMCHADAIACVVRLMERVGALEEITTQQQQKIVQQQQEIAQLQARLCKDSHNSSKPPSSDGLQRRTKSLRTQSGAKVGGQVGHPGSTLKKSVRVDHIITHPLPAHCDVCGHTLAGVVGVEETETRQVIDLPAIRFEVTEHRIVRAQCRCGAHECSSFPTDVISSVQYGASIRAAAVYLTQYQQLPFQRCAQALRDLFGVRISAASVVNYVQQAAEALRGAVAHIAQALLAQPVVHFDETGLRHGKTLVWMHSASTGELTWYGAHPKRGQEAMTAGNILPRFTGVAVHDGWQAYRHYDCLHALCNAHHLRELVFIFESTGQSWARQMMHVLCAAKEQMQVIREANGRPDAAWVQDIGEQYHALLRRGVIDNPVQLRPLDHPTRQGRVKQSAATNLLRRLYEYDQDVLRFTTDPNVPFDNNQAERDIRMPKLKQKVSGCFRTLHGIDAFCTIRSYLSTLHKAQKNLLHALTETFQGRVPVAV